VEKSNMNKFSKGANGETVLAISSGTIEMRNNKIIVLAD
jgi:F-type H+-transporting ATPase subunit epsilon